MSKQNCQLTDTNLDSAFGWVVVFAAVIGLMFGFSSMIGVTFGLFIKPFTSEFSWTRTEVALGFTAQTCTVMLLAPVAGKLVDRFGVRKVLLPSIMSLAMVTASMSLLSGNLIYFCSMYVLITLAGLGTLPISYTRVIQNWFDKKLGLALGISLTGVGLGTMMAPPLVQHLISSVGWRETYIIIAILILFISWPVVFFLLKERPEDVKSATKTERVEDFDRSKLGGLSLSEAIKDRVFWLLAVAFILLGIVTVAIIVHLPSLLTDRGLADSRAALAISTLGVAIIFSRIICGYLIDHFFAPYVAAGFMFCTLIGFVLLAVNIGDSFNFVAAALVGLIIGAEFDLMSYFVRRYLGLKSYGQLYGCMYATFNIGASLGPLFMAWMYDTRGSYMTSLWVMCVISLFVILLFFCLGPYRDDTDMLLKECE